MALNLELARLLACPKCLGGLAVLGAEDGLYCAACEAVYPVRDGIPVMLVDEACPLAKWTGSQPAPAQP
ncbi:MAG: Trm112 family protein [Proteobacteria bacterium]|nr:Trm112 family protein [Pseudomonadota bacterium]MBU1595037.1 Trm112 family protein [Pseudomonadota bacterium]